VGAPVAKELPYLPSYKNVGVLFEKIEKAKVPDAFNLGFLTGTIGLKGSGDRQLISLLKKMGFLDTAGKPTPEYSRLKNKGAAKGAIADGIRKAYAPLYAANEDAHNLPTDQLKGLIAQVSGAEEAMNRLITGTFNALVKSANFKQTEQIVTDGDDNGTANGDNGKESPEPDKQQTSGEKQSGGSRFNPDFRFNIEVHLPSNGTEETYLAIFNTLRKSLG
jgi:hypothetical protein